MICLCRIGWIHFVLRSFRRSGAVLILVFALFAPLLIDRIFLTLIESVILVHLISLIPFGTFIMLVAVSCRGLGRKSQIGQSVRASLNGWLLPRGSVYCVNHLGEFGDL